MPLDPDRSPTDTLSYMSPADRELFERVRKQLRDNEVTLKTARDESRRLRPEVERSVKVARYALDQLRATAR